VTAPRYATERDPAAPSDGKRIAALAKALGKPLMPWQQQVVDVATEHEPDGTYRYETVLITVPRQSGKTTLVGPVQLDRILMNDGAKVFYTAQTGKDARSRFNDLVKLVQASPLDMFAKYRYAAGSEAITIGSSSLHIFAPVAAALHGETPPLVTLDEIWEWDEATGDAILEGAIIPAQVTLAGRRQVWMISTAGSAASVFMRKWVDRGRAGWPRMAYFEWSLADDDDPYDPASLERFHPAVGHTVTTSDLLHTAGTVSRATWLRAFCNVWTEAADPLIPAEEWAALAQPQAVPSRRDIAVSYDIAPDNESGAVVAAWRDDDGAPCIRVLHAAPGTAWMHPYLVNLARQWQPAVLCADDGGPTRRLTDELRRTLGEDAVTTTLGRDFGTACEAFLTYCRDDRTLKHDGSQTLARAIQGAALKRAGDVTRFSRSASAGPIAGLIAAAVGLWVFDHREAPIGKPEVFSLADA
jgi:hypothetical protein